MDTPTEDDDGGDPDDHQQQQLQHEGEANEAAGEATQRCIKLSLEGFCRDIVLLEMLREMAPRMSALLTEAWHLIHLDFRERYERALRTKSRVLDEAKWPWQRARIHLRCCQGRPGRA